MRCQSHTAFSHEKPTQTIYLCNKTQNKRNITKPTPNTTYNIAMEWLDLTDAKKKIYSDNTTLWYPNPNRLVAWRWRYSPHYTFEYFHVFSRVPIFFQPLFFLPVSFSISNLHFSSHFQIAEAVHTKYIARNRRFQPKKKEKKSNNNKYSASYQDRKPSWRKSKKKKEENHPPDARQICMW